MLVVLGVMEGEVLQVAGCRLQKTAGILLFEVVRGHAEDKWDSSLHRSLFREALAAKTQQ